MAGVAVLKFPDQLTGKARHIAEEIVDTRKTLEGPFSVWVHAPEWAERVAHWVRWCVGRVHWSCGFVRSQHLLSAGTFKLSMFGVSKG